MLFLIICIIAGLLVQVLLWLILYMMLRSAIAGGIRDAAPAIAEALRQPRG